MRWPRTSAAHPAVEALALAALAALCGCASPGRSPDARAALSGPVFLAAAMDEKALGALENRCGVVVDVAKDPSELRLFRLEDCELARPRTATPYGGDAGQANCGVMALHPGHPFADPQRYSAAAILRLVAPLEGRAACVTGAYEGLGQFYFYGLVPPERKREILGR